MEIPILVAAEVRRRRIWPTSETQIRLLTSAATIFQTGSQDIERCHSAAEFAVAVHKETHQFLSQKSSSWEQAAESVDAFRLSVRLLRTGIDFVKARGKDPGILFSLTSAERAILEQALGVEKKD